MSQQGRILGIGGIFFKSANQHQMQEWYAQHLGLADSGEGVMLPWRAHDDPDLEQVTVWSIFPGDTTYLDPSPSLPDSFKRARHSASPGDGGGETATAGSDRAPAPPPTPSDPTAAR